MQLIPSFTLLSQRSRIRALRPSYFISSFKSLVQKLDIVHYVPLDYAVLYNVVLRSLGAWLMQQSHTAS